ncbi:hypothetical protein V1520DRAFT_335384 [Lipomyces starkeyi]|uniref:Uncharacterized protein n=1 Tax=Lipomyces starkeyi NRRL Y-11557 TaxID=675824 RepID=A0A1E3QB86_LIPST|nr:hypothetical protein LIPSTDRAFT_69086 [Lipomyces starkeyi NRRL Y-11557]
MYFDSSVNSFRKSKSPLANVAIISQPNPAADTVKDWNDFSGLGLSSTFNPLEDGHLLPDIMAPKPQRQAGFSSAADLDVSLGLHCPDVPVSSDKLSNQFGNVNLNSQSQYNSLYCDRSNYNDGWYRESYQNPPTSKYISLYDDYGPSYQQPPTHVPASPRIDGNNQLHTPENHIPEQYWQPLPLPTDQNRLQESSGQHQYTLDAYPPASTLPLELQTPYHQEETLSQYQEYDYRSDHYQQHPPENTSHQNPFYDNSDLQRVGSSAPQFVEAPDDGLQRYRVQYLTQYQGAEHPNNGQGPANHQQQHLEPPTRRVEQDSQEVPKLPTEKEDKQKQKQSQLPKVSVSPPTVTGLSVEHITESEFSGKSSSPRPPNVKFGKFEAAENTRSGAAPSESCPSITPESLQIHISHSSSPCNDFIPENGFPNIEDLPLTIPASLQMRVHHLRVEMDRVLACADQDQQLDWALSVVALGMTSKQLLARDDQLMLSMAHNVVLHLKQFNIPKLLYYLGLWCENGKMDMDNDPLHAYGYYQRAAEGGYTRAWYRMGIIHETQKNYAYAVDAFKQGIEKNDAGCCYALGVIYLKGLDGQEPDHELSRAYLRIAAENSDEDVPTPAYVYGQILVGEDSDWTGSSHIISKDLDLGRKFIERAAYLGCVAAQVRMGIAYQTKGLGCDYHPAISLHYYAIASRAGDSDAYIGLSSWFVIGDEDVFEKNEKRAFDYAKNAADLGNPRGYFALAYYYEVGIYVKEDTEEARKYYMKAAALNNPEAIERLSARQKEFSKKEHEKQVFTRRCSQRSMTISRKQKENTSKRDVRQLAPTVDDIEGAYKNLTVGRKSGVNYPDQRKKSPSPRRHSGYEQINERGERSTENFNNFQATQSPTVQIPTVSAVPEHGRRTIDLLAPVSLLRTQFPGLQESARTKIIPQHRPSSTQLHRRSVSHDRDGRPESAALYPDTMAGHAISLRPPADSRQHRRLSIPDLSQLNDPSQLLSSTASGQSRPQPATIGTLQPGQKQQSFHPVSPECLFETDRYQRPRSSHTQSAGRISASKKRHSESPLVSSPAPPLEQVIDSTTGSEKRTNDAKTEDTLNSVFQPLEVSKRPGPKTFEEMGIPRPTKDQDCCIM